MTLLIERLDVDFPKVTFVNNLLYASNSSDVEIVTEPYNVVLSTQSLIEHSDIVIMNTNAGLSSYCKNHLGIEAPHLRDYNKLQARAFSHILT